MALKAVRSGNTHKRRNVERTFEQCRASISVGWLFGREGKERKTTELASSRSEIDISNCNY